ncbi:sulfatase-like hydrolase/transferase, partial [Akkermansiaceae bacterium]|nr:sulfatase-like hydrolase/transferase [Akkermansiaceae bacterium]
KQLNDLGLAEDTVIILWGDHGWHLGEHSIWGKHALFEESLRAPLIISSPQVAQAGSSTKEIVESIDLFPTLCDLTGLTKPAFLNGHSLLPLLKSATAPSEGIAVSYHNKARTIRSATQRLIAHKDGQLELYDHNSPGGETKNLSSSQPEEATRLLEQLNQRYPK